MASVKIRDIPKFDGTNYTFWSKRMRAYLISLRFDVWASVTDGYVLPKTAPSIPEAKKACENNITALNAILGGLDRSEFVKVMNCDTDKEVWDKFQNVYKGDSKAQKAKLQTYRSQFEGLKMLEDENITAYFQRVEEVVNTMRGLGEKIEETVVVQKVLRSLPSRFNPKVSAVEDRQTLDQLKLDELQGILTAYEMRIEEPASKEATLKVTKKDKQVKKSQPVHEQSSSNLEDISDEEMANFVNKLPRGTDRKVQSSPAAVRRIYEIKGRSMTSPLAVCVADVLDVDRFAVTSHLPDGLLSSLLPGPVTLVLDRGKESMLEKSLNPGVDTIGIRIPECEFIRMVARNFGSALALTSANQSGQPSTVSIQEFEQLWQHCAYIYDGGQLPVGRAGSTIVDLTTPKVYKILRRGSASKETREILDIFGFKEMN